MRLISPELSAKRAAIGRRGGYATFFKYGRAQMAAWGRLGGRPRLLTLGEIESQAGSIISLATLLNERGKRSPAIYPRKSDRDLHLINKGGEPAVLPVHGSPERIC